MPKELPQEVLDIIVSQMTDALMQTTEEYMQPFNNHGICAKQQCDVVMSTMCFTIIEIMSRASLSTPERLEKLKQRLQEHAQEWVDIAINGK